MKGDVYTMSVKFLNVFIFGAGAVGMHIFSFVQEKFNVLAFLDNDKQKQGVILMDLPIIVPESIVKMEYDLIIVASHAGANTITEQLLGMGVERSKICTKYVDFTIKSRIVFLNKCSELFHERIIQGSVAECGVFMGEFAEEINRVFPNSKLYLFDTFSGFDERDLKIERNLTDSIKKNQYSSFKAGHFNITHEDYVVNRLPYPEKCIVRKGYFPETTDNINDNFCFVNLDFDLYQPTLAGLLYFYSRMVKGGVILVHDYFSGACKGVRKAVNEFESIINKQPMPIGDGLSVFFQF
jgi:hypothetical protein